MVILNEHLVQWYRAKVETSSDLIPEDIEDNRLEARTACNTFKALFANRIEFQTDNTFDEDKLEEYLREARPGHGKRILEQLSLWGSELIEVVGGADGKIFLHANTVEDLSAITEPFMRTVIPAEDDAPRPSLWPLVKVVR